MPIRSLMTLLLLVAAGQAASAQTFGVTIKAINAQKQPVPNADVSLSWDANNGVMTPTNPKDVKTNAEGTANIVVADWKQKRPVMVLSADRTQGGIVGVSKEDADKELVVTLGAMVKVNGTLDSKELGHAPKWANVLVIRDGIRPYFVQYMTKDAKFEFLLPVGKYNLKIYGEDINGLNKPVNLDADRSTHELGNIDLEATPIAKLKGKPLPAFQITDARGVKPDVALSAYKGKWVYIEFWGFW